MKNINSNWLGTPPEHWKALKLRQILRPFSEKIMLICSYCLLLEKRE